MSSLNLSKKSTSSLGGGTVPLSSGLSFVDSTKHLNVDAIPTGTSLALAGFSGSVGSSQYTESDPLSLHLQQIPNQQTILGGPILDYIDFNTLYDDGHVEGRMQWNDDDGTLEMGMQGGVVNLQVGQEHLIRCRNITGTPIPNGSVVRITGASGQRPTIALADASSTDACHTIGVATEAITSVGYVTIAGLVRDINTIAIPSGSMVWLSETAGQITATKPTAPAVSVRVGHVIDSHATEGILLVDLMVVPRLTQLSDVYDVAPTDGQMPIWSTANSRFEFVGGVYWGALTTKQPLVVGTNGGVIDDQSNLYYAPLTSSLTIQAASGYPALYISRDSGSTTAGGMYASSTNDLLLFATDILTLSGNRVGVGNTIGGTTFLSIYDPNTVKYTSSFSVFDPNIPAATEMFGIRSTGEIYMPYLDAKTTETNAIYFDTSTGLLTYGPITNYWSRSGTILSPVTTGDDIGLRNGDAIYWGTSYLSADSVGGVFNFYLPSNIVFKVATSYVSVENGSLRVAHTSGNNPWNIANSSGNISASHETNNLGTGYSLSFGGGQSSSTTATHYGGNLTLKGGNQAGIGGGHGGDMFIYGGSSVSSTRGSIYFGDGSSFCSLPVDDTETYVIGIDPTTGLLTRRVSNPKWSIRQITALRTLDDTDYQIECTANTFTVTLPTAVGITGKVYSIKNSGTGVITIACDGAQTIDGETTQSLNQWDNIMVMSNGSTGWIII